MQERKYMVENDVIEVDEEDETQIWVQPKRKLLVDRYEYKFYKVMDQWLHQASQALKHATSLTNDIVLPSS